MMRLSDIIGENPVKPKRFRMNFSCNSKPVEVKSVPMKKNFSKDSEVGELINELSNFSLKERLRESKMAPRKVLHKRVAEVANYLGRASRTDLENNRKIVLGYLNEYIYATIVKLMNDPSIDNINIIMALGLTSLIGDLSSVRELQKTLKRVKSVLLSKGYIPKEMQLSITKSYQDFWNEFKAALDDNYCSDANKGALIGRKNYLPMNMNEESRLAAFSKVDNNELEKLLLVIADNDSYEDKDFDPLFEYLKSDKTNYKEVLGDEDLATKINEYKNTNKKEDLINYIRSINNFSLDLSLADLVLEGNEYKKQEELDGSNEESTQESTPEQPVVDFPEREVISKSGNMEFGVIKKTNKAYVSFSHKDYNKVTLYSIPKGLKVTNFSELVNLPSKSIKVKSLDELIIRR